MKLDSALYVPLCILMFLSLPGPTQAASPLGPFASKQSLQYTGTWTNTSFGSTDTYTFGVELNGYDLDLTATIEGSVFGVGIALPLTFSSTLEPDGITTLTTKLPVYGDAEATLDFTKSPAEITATSTPDPMEVPGITPSTGEATFDFIEYRSTFTVNFTVGAPAVGVSNADLVPEAPAIDSLPPDPTIDAGETVELLLEASGSLISVQWYEGTSGDTNKPIAGADDLLFNSGPLTESTQVWARLTNHEGSFVDSPTIDVTVNPGGPLFEEGPTDPAGYHNSSWFGWVYIADAPWYYHFEHTYLYSTSTLQSFIWFYDLELGWFWTNSLFYPNLYRQADGKWYYYIPGTTNPRRFWDYQAEAYVDVPPGP